jgi:uncharacterized protein YodC (DUF2158 family)
MAEIKAGDVVQLKSGGPKMTVSSVDLHRQPPLAYCDWFDGTTKLHGAFPPHSLKLVQE